VDDQAGSAFTALFYHNLLEGRQSPVSALNAAQRELRRRPAFDHPYFWAPFSVFSA
jgi:CHAT domain-containing protein